MAKKVYTIDVEDKKLVTTKTKKARATKVKAESEVEKLGVAEINNASATKRMKNTVEKGFEKNVVGTTKKAVKQKVNEVENYFDFSLRNGTTVEKTVELEVCPKTSDYEESLNIVKEACKVDSLDNEARLVMNLARMGSLFDCDKRMIKA